MAKPVRPRFFAFDRDRADRYIEVLRVAAGSAYPDRDREDLGEIAGLIEEAETDIGKAEAVRILPVGFRADRAKRYITVLEDAAAWAFPEVPQLNELAGLIRESKTKVNYAIQAAKKKLEEE